MAAAAFAAPDPAYRSSLQDWRRDYAARLSSESGWLTVSGLYWLREGENTFGSGKENDIVLPYEAPQKAGAFTLKDRKVTVNVEKGSPAKLNGKPVPKNAELRPGVPEHQLTLGDLTLFPHASGSRLAIRVKDKNSELRRGFKGLRWFAPDEAYRVEARYVPFEKPKPLTVLNVMGDEVETELVGALEFELGGRKLSLEAEDDGDSLFIVFKDQTSNKETYAAARFLEAKKPIDDVVVLDFNRAHNPPCAYNKHTTCPLPPSQNRLPVRVEAGERAYPGEH
jgi:uncharacterized protein